MKRNQNQVSRQLFFNRSRLEQRFSGDGTLRTRELEGADGCAATLYFIDGLVQPRILNENVISPLQQAPLSGVTADLVIRRVLSACDSSAQEDFDKLCFSLTLGNAILFVDGLNKAIVIDCKNWSLRSVQEPDNERVLQGPREGFNESLLTNLSLLRRRLTGSDFKAEFLTMGDVSENNVCLCYLESCVDKKVLDELRTRLSKVKSSAILDTT